MKNIWYIVNIGLVALALRGGYVSTAPERLRHSNPDAISCGIILLISPLFALWSVNYSMRRWHHETLRRPSLSRNPLNWWHDPLESLFISTCVFAAGAIGGAARRPLVDSVGFWMVGVQVCFAAGLSIGQLLIYRMYRKQIIPAD
ncbi:MAG TPA: hypothetical protein VGI46_16440 [Candidatus Acidoferrum sp.]|jgi:hypothetical protein